MQSSVAKFVGLLAVELAASTRARRADASSPLSKVAFGFYGWMLLFYVFL